MYSLPQEIEVWYIIPAIRKALAKSLTGTYKFSYEKAGRILGISKAAISQYLSDKRANKIKLSKEVLVEIDKSASTINDNEKMALVEIQRILKYMRENRHSCEACKFYNKGVVNYCNSNPGF